MEFSENYLSLFNKSNRNLCIVLCNIFLQNLGYHQQLHHHCKSIALWCYLRPYLQFLACRLTFIKPETMRVYIVAIACLSLDAEAVKEQVSSPICIISHTASCCATVCHCWWLYVYFTLCVVRKNLVKEILF